MFLSFGYVMKWSVPKRSYTVFPEFEVFIFYFWSRDGSYVLWSLGIDVEIFFVLLKLMKNCHVHNTSQTSTHQFSSDTQGNTYVSQQVVQVPLPAYGLIYVGPQICNLLPQLRVFVFQLTGSLNLLLFCFLNLSCYDILCCTTGGFGEFKCVLSWGLRANESCRNTTSSEFKWLDKLNYFIFPRACFANSIIKYNYATEIIVIMEKCELIAKTDRKSR